MDGFFCWRPLFCRKDFHFFGQSVRPSWALSLLGLPQRLWRHPMQGLDVTGTLCRRDSGHCRRRQAQVGHVGWFPKLIDFWISNKMVPAFHLPQTDAFETACRAPARQAAFDIVCDSRLIQKTFEILHIFVGYKMTHS